MIVKITYNKNIYGKEIEKIYDHVVSIHEMECKIVIVSYDNGINNYEISKNETIKMSITMEDE